MGGRVLIVEDDRLFLRALTWTLASGGYDAVSAGSAADALTLCAREMFDAVLTDACAHGLEGIDLVLRLQRSDPDVSIVVLTETHDVEKAVRAMQCGAFDCLRKPIEGSALLSALAGAVTNTGHKRAVGRSRLPTARGRELAGSDIVMRELSGTIGQLAGSPKPVLIIGEPGIGKEVVAREIHSRANAKAAFVIANILAMPPAMVMSELFGDEPAAANGRRGLIRLATGGSIFLDGVHALPGEVQLALLEWIDADPSEPRRRARSRDRGVRVVAATHVELGVGIDEGWFSAELRARFEVVRLLPLRMRSHQIAELAEAFLVRARERWPSSRVSSMEPALVEALSARTWPGNVRELESTIDAMVRLARGTELELRHLKLITADRRLATELADVLGDAKPVTLDTVVWRHVEAVLESTQGNKARTAKLLGIDPATLHRWFRRREE